MYLADFNREVIVSSKEELFNCLDKRPAFNSNQFILTFNDSGFPQLSVFVKNDWYVIYYLGEEGKSFVSVGKEKVDGNLVTFYENIHGAEIAISSECVIGIDRLKVVVEDFFLKQERSANIGWGSL